ncbi:5182_t:CDS:2 [Funneliformis geosporum]|uniref:1080_t:CDS:1 n=1 Tax=Funneliformis geosporum TaxID=1117311 RepID=A0A9W4WTU4_9GLOM|nr:5182_t:CDS:2 [Funneliformis geosporum]CAI2178497.1 1080_t:CDS:2 [Funneliformis geosporum]
MTDGEVTSTFEFTLPENVIKDCKTYYTPPFASSYNAFWQLKFSCSSKSSRAYTVDLIAIANREDQLSDNIWKDHSNVFQKIYCKVSESKILDERYICANFSRYHNSHCALFFIPRPYKKLIIGVNFIGSSLELNSFEESDKRVTNPNKIISMWSDEFDDREASDVQFNVHNDVIFARRSILTKRSKYFRNLFKEDGSEMIKINKNDSHYILDVPDFSPKIFLKMLNFLYTDELILHDERDIMQLFAISEKFFITNLKELVKFEIVKRLTPKSSIGFLFNNAWKSEDLKNEVIEYICRNFDAVRDTEEFKNIGSITSGHPAGVRIMQELLLRII